MEPQKSVQFWFPNLWLLVRRPQHVGASSICGFLLRCAPARRVRIADCGLERRSDRCGVWSSLVEFGRVWYDVSVGILALPNPIIVSRRTRMPMSTTKIFFGSDRFGWHQIASEPPS